MTSATPTVVSDDILGLLGWAIDTYGTELRLACSLSVEDCLLVHLTAAQAALRGVKPTVFVLDTGRLHEETYQTLERLRRRYDLPIHTYAPRSEAVEQLVTLRGPLSFRESVPARQECCAIRKVEPLSRALSGASAWVTGLRRAHSAGRSTVAQVEKEEKTGRMKLNPLALLTDDELWTLVHQHQSIVHPLHQQGFPSIGCAPCTRAISADEHPRAGRWWWEDPSHSECGLHSPASQRIPIDRVPQLQDARQSHSFPQKE